MSCLFAAYMDTVLVINFQAIQVCLVEIEEGDVKRIVSHEEMKLTSEKTWARSLSLIDHFFCY